VRKQENIHCDALKQTEKDVGAVNEMCMVEPIRLWTIVGSRPVGPDGFVESRPGIGGSDWGPVGRRCCRAYSRHTSGIVDGVDSGGCCTCFRPGVGSGIVGRRSHTIGIALVGLWVGVVAERWIARRGVDHWQSRRWRRVVGIVVVVLVGVVEVVVGHSSFD